VDGQLSLEFGDPLAGRDQLGIVSTRSLLVVPGNWPEPMSSWRRQL